MESNKLHFAISPIIIFSYDNLIAVFKLLLNKGYPKAINFNLVKHIHTQTSRFTLIPIHSTVYKVG